MLLSVIGLDDKVFMPYYAMEYCPQPNQRVEQWARSEEEWKKNRRTRAFLVQLLSLKKVTWVQIPPPALIY